jgi:eukaryotic-like serine/threonine-protein kinase
VRCTIDRQRIVSALIDLAPCWPRVSALLDDALALRPGARAAWFEALGTESSVVKDSLRRLLAAQAKIDTGDFLADLPALQTSEPAAINTLEDGTTIGPYRLVRLLGEGGMGAVWLAERVDGQLRRSVALKLPHATWGGNLAERLARERDILATLEHPHIARLYDAGIDTLGRPWLALEYVQGCSIDAYARERGLDIDARLALVLQVCAAVSYAHSRLVIHRDLKPANILVTEEGQVRLLDFGIAKLMQDEQAEATALTRAAGRALTPDYASPEQIAGAALTTASDVYSLGVIAYALLCGKPPYKLRRGTAGELEDAIAGIEPPLASDAALTPLLRRQLRGDLDAILNKALKKRPAERYQTANELADDVKRHLRGEPVSAQPDRLGYRAGRFIKRHRLPVVSGAVTAIALVGGTAIAVMQAQRATAQATRAEDVKQFVLSMLASADTGMSGGNRTTSALDLLTRAHQRIGELKLKDASVASELLTVVGDGMVGLGEYQPALPVLEEALVLAQTRWGGAHPSTANAHLSLGELLIELGRRAEAKPHLDAAEKTFRGHHDARQLMHTLRWQSFIAQTPAATVAAATEAAQLAETLPAESQRARMLAYYALADALIGADRPGRVAAARRAYDLARALHGDRGTVDTLSARSLWAHTLVIEGQARQGLEELKASLPLQEALLGSTHMDVMRTTGRIANAAQVDGDIDVELGYYRRGRDVFYLRDGDTPSTDSARWTYFHGVGLVHARRWSEADAELQHALAMFRKVSPPDESYVRRTLAAQGGVRLRRGEVREAAQLLEPLQANLANDQPRDRAMVQTQLASLRSRQQRHEEALALLDEAETLLRDSPRRIDHARMLAVQAEVLLDAGRAEPAHDAVQRCLTLYQQTQGLLSPEHADVLLLSARILLTIGRATDAVEAAARAAQGWEKLRPRSRNAGLAYLWLARAEQAAKLDGGSSLQRAREAFNADAEPADRELLARHIKLGPGPARSR